MRLFVVGFRTSITRAEKNNAGAMEYCLPILKATINRPPITAARITDADAPESITKLKITANDKYKLSRLPISRAKYSKAIIITLML